MERKEIVMSLCIYCKKDKHNFQRREHVIPQAFGLFNPDNFILNDREKQDKSVCDDCNAKLGNEIEDYLATESYEGYILRPKHLAKEPRDRIKKNIVIKANEGDHKGIYLKLNKDNTVSPLPQIGLRKKNGNWDYFLLGNLESIDKNLYDASPNNLFSISLDKKDTIDAFKKIGIKFNYTHDAPPPKHNIEASIDFSVPNIVLRSMAKIAFNYFAYFNPKNVILNKTFDTIRDFIIDGKPFDNSRFTISNDPILINEPKGKRYLGHIITIGKNEHECLNANVSLFNYMKYEFLLSEPFEHKDLKIGFGHFFNVSNGEILEIENRKKR